MQAGYTLKLHKGERGDNVWRYVVKRVLLAMLTLFIIITLTFFLMHAVPGGPFNKEKALSPDVQKQLEERFHLDKPVGEQFLIYLQNIAHLDFGISLKTGRDILTTLQGSIAVSAKLGFFSIIVSLVFGLLLGITAALFRNQWPDRLIILVTTFFVSAPSFVLASLLLLIVCVKWQLVPVFTIDQPHLLLPVLALAMYPMSYITRLTKSSMLDVLGQDYIRTANAKGVAQRRVLGKHALRNALLPVITYVGPMTAYTLTGSLVVEKVFTLGGMGQEFIKAIQESDYPMIMAVTILLGSMMVLMTLLSDLLYKAVDPRITFD